VPTTGGDPFRHNTTGQLTRFVQLSTSSIRAKAYSPAESDSKKGVPVFASHPLGALWSVGIPSFTKVDGCSPDCAPPFCTLLLLLLDGRMELCLKYSNRHCTIRHQKKSNHQKKRAAGHFTKTEPKSELFSCDHHLGNLSANFFQRRRRNFAIFWRQKQNFNGFSAPQAKFCSF
jgi:hypothetical protein